MFVPTPSVAGNPTVSIRFWALDVSRGWDGPGSRRIQRPPCRIDPQVKYVGRRSFDKRGCFQEGWCVGRPNILRLRPRLIHDDLVESGHEKVHDPILLDLDLFGSITWFTGFPGWAVFNPRPKATETLSRLSSSAIAKEAVKPMPKSITRHIMDSVQRFIWSSSSVLNRTNCMVSTHAVARIRCPLEGPQRRGPTDS